MENITAVFKEKKLKLTPQRLAVYKYLMSTKEHPSAEAIYKAIQTRSEERRVGKECASMCRSRWSPYH